MRAGRGRIRFPIPLVAAALALVAVGATAAATEPSGRGDARPVVAGGTPGGVLRASVVCPDLRFIDGTLTTTVAVGTASTGPGSVSLSAAAGQDRTGFTVLSAGQTRGLYAGPLTGPLELLATGQLANSLVAEQSSRANKTADRGRQEARCEPPRAEQWFVGASTQPGNTPVLELANPTDTPAITDVVVYTPDGISPTSTAHNLSLAPHTVLTVKVADLAPNAVATAVKVTTASGRVSAAVLDTRTAGLNMNGTDWLPVTGQAVSQTITGIPGAVDGAAPTRSLIVADPGDVDAHVQVQVIGPAGTFVPLGMDSLSVPAGTVKTIDLSGPLAAAPGGVIVTSSDPDVPIVSNVLVDAPSVKSPTIREITYLGPNVPLRGAALIPLVTIAVDTDSVVILSAPGDAATVTLVTTDAAGVVHQTPVTVPAGSTQSVSLRQAGAADGSVATVVPDPGAPTVYATRLIDEDGARGPLISSLALIGAPPQQRVPPVAAEPLS